MFFASRGFVMGFSSGRGRELPDAESLWAVSGRSLSRLLSISYFQLLQEDRTKARGKKP
jgi:hypothetical protein